MQHTNIVFCMYDCLDKSPCIIYFSCDRGPRRSSKVEPDLFYFNDAWRCIAILSLESYCICLRCAITWTKNSLRNGLNNSWFPILSTLVNILFYLIITRLCYYFELWFFIATYMIFLIQLNIFVQWFNTARPKNKLKTILVFYDHILSADSLNLSIKF